MIPKIVHFCWISGDPYPELIDKCIRSWEKHLVDYQFVLWDKSKIESIQSEWLQQTVGLKKYAFAADFIRIYALLNYGGIYLDTDVELVASLDPFLNHDFFIGIEYNNDLEPAVFGAVKGHYLLKDLLDYYNNKSFLKKNGKLDVRPLPEIFNEIVVKRFGVRSKGNKLQIQDKRIVTYPSEYFSPKNIYSQRIITTRNTVSIHHFEGNWFSKDYRYKFKQMLHRLLIAIGGKVFHNQIVHLIRKVK